MLGIFPSWLFFVLAGALASGNAFYRRRPSVGIGIAMAVALTSATWVAPKFAGASVDARVALAVLGLCVFCAHPAGRFHFSLVWLDVVAVSLLIVGVGSDWRFTGIDFGVPSRVYGEIVLPYFAGRFCAMRCDGARGSSHWIVVAGMIVCSAAIVESFTGANFWEWMFATKDNLVKHGGTVRYGLLHRATGPTRHSIFLGVMLMLLVPWCFLLIARKDSQVLKTLGWIGLIVILAGVIATMSRGPMLALALAGTVATTVVWPWLFKWYASFSLLLIVLAFSFPGRVLSVIEYTELGQDMRAKVIEVDGNAQVFTGTRNRLWVWEIYAPLVVKGGPLGFGTLATSSFPPNIPGIPVSRRASETFGIVDNSYLLIGLRYGWIGGGLFVALLGGSIVTAIRLRRSAGMILYPDGPAFLTAMASILVGVGFEILTVFSSFDFMFWIYFHCGVIAGLASLRASMLKGDVDAAAVVP